jgi:hypothetical protein
VGILLLTWNGVAASLASPFVLNHRYDGIQYQLLARNRLHGHYEVGDTAHTVGTEGRHPMWRPGLVWIEEGLARCLGSVRTGAAAASALGTTFLELTLLWLAWSCFGRKTWLFVLIALPAPAVSGPFLTLAVGQGPEVWAAAWIVAGLAALVVALQRRSWAWALLAGMVAGSAEWFRTGNLLLFAVPCGVYGLVALWQRDRRGFGMPVGALASFVAMATLCDWTVPSALNKTVANLWHRGIESGGPLVPGRLPDGTPITYSMANYTLVPGTAELAVDSVIRRSHDKSTLEYIREHSQEIIPAYLQSLQEAATGGFWGLRDRIGDLVLLLFAVQLLLLTCCREPGLPHTAALAGGALAHYLGPVMLLTGDQPTHYLLVAFPLFLVVAGRGAHRLVDGINAVCKRGQAVLAQPQPVPWVFVAVGLALLIGLSAPYYRSALYLLRGFQQQTSEEQAAVDALGLEGRKVACRNMCWFVDRNVHTILLPYATVAELETYARDHRIDGILVWEKEPMPFFNANPYGSAAAFDRALQASALFGSPRASGAWRWYPVRPAASTKEQT